jgi:hypothetical protein
LFLLVLGGLQTVKKDAFPMIGVTLIHSVSIFWSAVRQLRSLMLGYTREVVSGLFLGGESQIRGQKRLLKHDL